MGRRVLALQHLIMRFRNNRALSDNDASERAAISLAQAFVREFDHPTHDSGSVRKLGGGDGSGMTGWAETGWEIMDGVGVAAGRDGR